MKTFLALLGPVTVQLDKVEVHELKPKMLTKDEGVLIHY